MKLALIGYGKLGRLIEEVALEKGHCVALKIHSGNQELLDRQEIFEEIDLCIDFSHPGCVVDNIRKMISYRKEMIVGTTGWYNRLDQVREWVLAEQVGLLYAPNFSIGMLLFMHLVSHAAQLIGQVGRYDVAGWEMHHNAKQDAPSGSAMALTHLLLTHFCGKQTAVYGPLERQILPNELQFSSIRCGHDPGTHEIIFDSSGDTITLTHRNRNRRYLAEGVIEAALWLKGKRGCFSLEDMLLKVQP